MLGQNQANLDAVIGSANYDIGHVFSTGGGGIAGLGVVCRTGNKARGVTGSPAPIGDAFDIDYVAHEMGHQFGANHCFNGNAGSCAGGNRNASTAYEPGSGSDHHGLRRDLRRAEPAGAQRRLLRLDQHPGDRRLLDHRARATAARSRPPPGVIEPTVDAGRRRLHDSAQHPLRAHGVGDHDRDRDLLLGGVGPGAGGAPEHPRRATRRSSAPSIPVASPTRIFPKLSNILNNNQTIGEILPSYARNLSFKRHRARHAGRRRRRSERWRSPSRSPRSGPFLVTYPNTAVTWLGGTQETVTWNVAGTNAAPVNCATVNILLSTDGGNTWPTSSPPERRTTAPSRSRSPAIPTTWPG